eukprot:3913340-Pyramimonas_sp.AAC.1
MQWAQEPHREPRDVHPRSGTGEIADGRNQRPGKKVHTAYATLGHLDDWTADVFLAKYQTGADTS